MKKLLSEKVKDMKAITLIALVITIVVLIILAAVAINLSLGDNGIFNRAKTAKEQYQNTTQYEETEIAKASNEIDSYVDGNRGTVTLTEEEYQIFKNQTQFSTSEKKIGTWIDGKSIYRKTITGNYDSEFTILPNGTYDKIINIYGTFNNVNGTPIVFPYANLNYYITSSTDGQDGKGNLKIKGNGFPIKDCKINVEYTKP